MSWKQIVVLIVLILAVLAVFMEPSVKLLAVAVVGLAVVHLVPIK